MRVPRSHFVIHSPAQCGKSQGGKSVAARRVVSPTPYQRHAHILRVTRTFALGSGVADQGSYVNAHASKTQVLLAAAAAGGNRAPASTLPPAAARLGHSSRTLYSWIGWVPVRPATCRFLTGRKHGSFPCTKRKARNGHRRALSLLLLPHSQLPSPPFLSQWLTGVKEVGHRHSALEELH